MKDFEDVFDTPVLKYVRIKKAFLQEFLDPKAWGEQAFRERIVAFEKFLQYLQETSDLGVLHPSLEAQVHLDNRQLAMGKILPFPDKLYEEMMWDVVKDEEPGEALNQSAEKTLSKIKSFLINRQRSCIMLLESQVWEEVHDYENYSKPAGNTDEITSEKPEQPDLKRIVMCKLRRLRRRLYSMAKAGQDVSSEIYKYQGEVDHFIMRFKEDMSNKELST